VRVLLSVMSNGVCPRNVRSKLEKSHREALTRHPWVKHKAKVFMGQAEQQMRVIVCVEDKAGAKRVTPYGRLLNAGVPLIGMPGMEHVQITGRRRN
jgi:hypothetical protein